MFIFQNEIATLETFISKLRSTSIAKYLRKEKRTKYCDYGEICPRVRIPNYKLYPLLGPKQPNIPRFCSALVSQVLFMELYDYEFELQSEIIAWKCSRPADCLMEFVPKPRHIKLGMRGLVWSIQALPLRGSSSYTFNIMEVKRSRAPLSLSESTNPDLPSKFKLLQLGFENAMSSVFRADEALDKLYAFSLLFSRAMSEDKPWWMIVDAEIAVVGCKTAWEAAQQAAKAAAAFGAEIEPPIFEDGNIVAFPTSERTGWWIEQWTVPDELWATAFSDLKSDSVRQFQAEAVERGNIFQWCSVQVFDTPYPSFQLEIQIKEFLERDDMVLRIGVANRHLLRIRVSLMENVKVVCSQEGIETGTSLGLCSLLPDLVREYIKAALKGNEAELSSDNVVQGVLQRVVRYLVFLGRICVVCGCDLPMRVPLTSTCSNICRARKQILEAMVDLAKKERLEEESIASASRREEYVRMLYPNTHVGLKGLKSLFGKKEGIPGVSIRLPLFLQNLFRIGRNHNELNKIYEDLVRKVARMSSSSIAIALQIEMALWSEDAD